MAESTTEGLTWGPVRSTDLPNPGSGLDAVRLNNGHWILVYNDTQDGEHDRSQLAVSLSLDEGRTWSATRYLEKHETGAFHYPAVIQTRDQRIHVVYSYFSDAGKSMKHVSFDEAWLTRKPQS
jgi:predicted neuraminidase